MSAKKSTARRPAHTYGDEQLQTIQRDTFGYFWEETNPENGLIPDNTSADDIPASIAGVGFALASYPEYRLYSRKVDPRTGRRRNLGTFGTRAAAEKHERAIQFFKRH